MLADERALIVGPLQHHDSPAKVLERDVLAVAVRSDKVGRGAADAGAACGGGASGAGERGCEKGNHPKRVQLSAVDHGGISQTDSGASASRAGVCRVGGLRLNQETSLAVRAVHLGYNDESAQLRERLSAQIAPREREDQIRSGAAHALRGGAIDFTPG